MLRRARIDVRVGAEREARALAQARADRAARGRDGGVRPHGRRAARTTRRGARGSSGAIAEACAVAAADGVVAARRRPSGRSSTRWPTRRRPSAARDVAAGRRSELDAIVGGVLRAGRAPRRAVPDARPSSPPPPGSGERASAVAFVPARSGSERVPHKNIRPLAGHPLLAYAIETALPERLLRARRRLDRLGGDRRRRALVRRRRSLPPPGRVRDLDVTRHRVAHVHARAPRRALRPLRARPRDESVPRPRRRAARPRAAARDARGRLAPRRRAREAAPGEDVAARRRRPHDDARCSTSRISTSPGTRASTRRSRRSTSRTARSRSPGRAS